MRKRIALMMAVLATAYTVFMLGVAAENEPLLRPFGVAEAQTASPPATQPAVMRWSMPVTVPLCSPDASALSLAFDPASGRLHLMWEESVATGSARLRHVIRDLRAGQWLADAPAEDWPGDTPSLALDGAGWPHVVYALDFDGLSRIFYRRRDSGGWQLPRRVSSTSGMAWHPTIVLAADGEIHVVWAEALAAPEAIYQVYHARATGWGEQWYSVEPILPARGYAPRLALAPDGSLWLAYQAKSAAGSAEWDVYASAFRSGAWVTPTNVSASAGSPSRSPDLVCDEAGVLHLVWEEESLTLGLSSVYYASASSADGAWSTPQALSAPTGAVERPRIALGARGMVHAVWNNGTRFEYASLRPGDSWSAPQVVATNAGGIRDVSLVADANGGLHAVWGARVADVGWLLFSADRPPEPLPAPTATASPSPANTLVPAPSITPTPAISVTLTATLSLTTTPSLTGTPSATAVLSPTATPTSTLALTETPTGKLTSTPAPTATSTALATETPTATAVPSDTPQPSETPTPSPSATPEPPTPTATWQPSPSPTATVGPPPTLVPRYYMPLMLNAPDAGTDTDGQARVRAPRAPYAERAVPSSLAWGWSPATDISSSSYDSHSPALAISPLGVAYAVWMEKLPSGRPILCSSVLNVGEWSTPMRFYIGEDPALAITPDGVAHLVYANEFFGNYDIFHTAWTGTGWSTPENVSATSGASTQPAITTRSDGSLLAAWTDTTEGHPRIYYAWKSTGVWNSFYIPTTTGGGLPTLGLTRGGRVWAAWQLREEADPTSRYDVFASYNQGDGWASYSINVSDSDAADSVAPKMAGNGTLGCFLAWQEGLGGAARVVAADDLESVDWWSLPYSLSLGLEPAERPAIAVTDGNDVHVAWPQGLTLRDRWRDRDTGVWMGQTTVITATQPSEDPVLAGAPARGVGALWGQQVAVQDRDIMYASGALQWPSTLSLAAVFRR